MMLDWNWFFASFTQCSAALIAIIGAFIISKLLGEVEKVEIHSSKVDQLVIHYSELLKRISARFFDWHDKTIIDYSSSLEKSIKNKEFQGLNDNEKLEKLFKIEADLFRTSSCKEKLDEKIAEYTPKITNIGQGVFLENMIKSMHIPPDGTWDKLSEERETINQLKIESENLINWFYKTRTDILASKNNLTPIKVTIYILSIGLLITVIYPLHFMPIGINQHPTLGFSLDVFYNNLFSLKGLLLFFLTLVIEGIFGYFLWLINTIDKKYTLTTSRLEGKYFDLSSYSKYF